MESILPLIAQELTNAAEVVTSVTPVQWTQLVADEVLVGKQQIAGACIAGLAMLLGIATAVYLHITGSGYNNDEAVSMVVFLSLLVAGGATIALGMDGWHHIQAPELHAAQALGRAVSPF